MLSATVPMRSSAWFSGFDPWGRSGVGGPKKTLDEFERKSMGTNLGAARTGQLELKDPQRSGRMASTLDLAASKSG